MKHTIYTATGATRVDFEGNSNSTHDYKVQTNNELNLSFTLYDYVELDVNDYIDLSGMRFVLLKPYKPVMKSTKEYTYDLKFFGPENIADTATFLDTNYDPISSYYDTPSAQLTFIVSCINRVVGSTYYHVGEVVSTAPIKVDYTRGCTCLEALSTLSKACETEWWLDGVNFNLSKCEHGEPVTLAYGKGLLGLEKQLADTDAFFTRLLPTGSTKNIVPSKYGHNTLQLPNGKKWIDRNVDLYGIKEKWEENAFADIFPRFTGTVGVVRSEKRTVDNKEITVYYFTTPDIPFNPNSYSIANTYKHVVFKSGDLLGQDFEANWNENTAEWELITQYPTENTQLPGDNVIPRTGDKYTVYNLDMPTEYYPLAEQELEAAVIDILDKAAIDFATYKGATDHVYLEEQGISLTLGRRVRLENNIYFPSGYRDSRITRIVRKLSDLNDMDIEISNTIIQGQYTSLKNDVADLKNTFAQTLANEILNIIRTTSSADLTDNNVLSSLRSLAEIKKRALSRLEDDEAAGIIEYLKGWTTDTYSIGTSGGALYKDADGNWHIQAEYMHVLRKFTAEEIEIQKTSHLGGKLMLTAASMVCINVEEQADAYRCFMRTEDADGNKIYNQFKAGDQALVETFNLLQQEDGKIGNHYLWRLVTAVGEDYIDLSKTVCASGSDVPLVADHIVQLGYQGTDDSDRQTAQILAGAGNGSPYIKQYIGINSFTLPEEDTRLKPDDNLLTGVVHIKEGSTGAGNLTDLPDEVLKAAQLGAVNLLRNSGFTGNYETETLEANTQITSDTELYSKALKYWTGTATVNEETEAVSERSVTIGSLAQSLVLIPQEQYVVSFKAKGANVSVSYGTYSQAITLTEDYNKYTLKFAASAGDTFMISGDATVCDLQLERGTIATDWRPSPSDNDKTLAEFQALTYLQDAIKNGSVDIIGGLILANILQVGNYKDGQMQKVTAGISGVYNSDDDVAFWAGGTYSNAIATMTKFINNPNYEPTDEEWNDMAKIVFSHGGNGIFSGWINAFGGIFRGIIKIANGMFSVKSDGSGNIGEAYRWDSTGTRYVKSREIIEWRDISKELLDAGITDIYNISLSGGTFLDTYDFNYTNEAVINLPSPLLYHNAILDIKNTATTRVTASLHKIKCTTFPILKYNETTDSFDSVIVYSPMNGKGECLIECQNIESIGWRWVANENMKIA